MLSQDLSLGNTRRANRFALACVDNNDMVRMRIALAEVNRLDKMHDYRLSAESPDKGA